MEQTLNIQTPISWDKKKPFAIVTYEKVHSDPQYLKEVHREDITFSSFENLQDMTVKVGVYNTQEVRTSIAKDIDSYTEKRIIQL